MVLGWSGKYAENPFEPKIQESNRLQKVETSVKLPPDYQILPGEEAKLFNLEEKKLIWTKPSLSSLKEEVKHLSPKGG